MMFLRRCIAFLLVTCFSLPSFANVRQEDFYKRKGTVAALPWPTGNTLSPSPRSAGASSDANPGGGEGLLPSPPHPNAPQSSPRRSSSFSRFSDNSQSSHSSFSEGEITEGFPDVKLSEQPTVINNSLQFYSSPHFVLSSNSSVESSSPQKHRLLPNAASVATGRSLPVQLNPDVSLFPSDSFMTSPVSDENDTAPAPNATSSHSSPHNTSTSTQSFASLSPSLSSSSSQNEDSLLSSANNTSSLPSYAPQTPPSDTQRFGSRQSSPHEEFKEHSIFTPMVVHSRTKRHIPDSTWHPESQEHHHDITLGLTIDDQNVLVDLQLNRDLLPHGYFEKRLLRNGSHVIRRPTGQDAGLCHYQGSIRDRPGSWAALSTCHGLSGMVYDGNETHYMERVPESEPSLSSPHFLLSHKHLLPRNLSCGYKGHSHPSLDLFKDESFAKMLRYKRSTSNSLDDDRQPGSGGRIRGPYNSNSLSRYVELVLVADHLEFQNQGEDVNKIHKRFKDIANIANALYQPLNIFIALVGVEVWEEEDQVVISQDGDLTLTNFLNYRKVRLIPEHPNDNAQLLTGQVFDSGVVGKALKGPICTYQYSGGVNMDHSSSVGLVATTVAHEMGHNFGMEHDTEEDCQCPDSRCIMAPSSGSRSPSHWSSCSHEYLALSFERSMDYCLRNKPRTLFDSPVCGNSFVEPGEQCDCGLAQHCNNPCCDPETCLLYQNATCATGQCCDLQTCRPKEAGTECRSAHRECDLPEYCRGDSEYCPDDVFQEDGHECHAGKAFCHSGMCRSHEQQCQLLWGPTGQNSHDDCYSLNTQGNNNGNCGYNWANDTYAKCSTVNRKCGMMHCKHFNERLEFGMESVSKVSHRFIQGNEREIIPCRVAQVDLGLDMVDPGLAPDGAKCGYQKMCVNQVCMPVASLRKEGCNCHGNGACNNLGHCHCALGFAPPDCLEPGYGGSIDSGPASNPHATNKFVVGLFVFFFAIIPLVVASLCLVYYVRGNLGLIGLWLTKKGLPGSTRLPSCDPETGRRGAVGLQRGISTASTGGVPSSPISSCESKSNSPLLNGSATIVSPSLPVAGAKGDNSDEFFGKHPGFTLAPVDSSNLSNGVGSPVHSVNGVANGVTKASSVPPQPVRQAPAAPAKVSISRPSLKASTNRAVQPVSQAPSVPKTLPPPPPPSSVPPVAVVNPQRRPHSAAPRPLSVPDHNSVIISRPSTATPIATTSPANSSKSSGSTVSRLASFLNKKDKSADEPGEQEEKDASRSSTLPRKASKINRESLMQLEISAPMQLQATKLPENLVPVRAAPEPPTSSSSNPTQEGSKSTKVTWAPSVTASEKRNAVNSSEIQRIGSMREPSVTLRPPIPKFGSMRTPRPKSLPPARPSDPPPRPPLPTIPSPGSDDLYDDCAESYNSPAPMASLEEDTSSPTESIYATIEEGTSPENASSVESKILDSDGAAEQEPFYANSAAAVSPPDSSAGKKSMFSFLYGKAKRKKKDSVEEPLYSNIGGNDTADGVKEVPSPPSRSSSLTPPDRTSCGSSEDGGLLSEIVSELVTREPDFRDALVHKKKAKSAEEKRGAFSLGKNNVSLASNKLDSLDESTPLPKVDSTSSSQVSRSITYPWKSQASSKSSSLSSSHSAGSDNQKPLSKPGSVLSYLKRSLPNDQENTIVEDTGQKSEAASPDLKCPITAMSNTTITTQIMSDAAPTLVPQTTSANNRLESSLEAVRIASKQLKNNDCSKVEDTSAKNATPLYSNVSSKTASVTTPTAKSSPASAIEVKPPPTKQASDNVVQSFTDKGQAKPVSGKPTVPSASKPLASQVSVSSGNSVDKSSSSVNSASTASISSASSKSGPLKSTRPAFPPDKVLFPPDKPSVVGTKASKTEGAVPASSNASASRANTRAGSTGKGKILNSRNKTTGNNAVSSGKPNDTVSKPARVLSPTRPSAAKSPQTSEKGNVPQAKSGAARTKSPGVGGDSSDSKEPKKSTLSSSSTSAARSSGRRPAVRSNTAFGGKSVGSSNVASLQQKFEKEATGSSAENVKTAVPGKVSSARKTSDSKPSVTPRPRT